MDFVQRQQKDQEAGAAVGVDFMSIRSPVRANDCHMASFRLNIIIKIILFGWFLCKDGLKIAIKREQTKTCFEYAEQERFIKRPTRYQPRATPWVNNGVVDCVVRFE